MFFFFFGENEEEDEEEHAEEQPKLSEEYILNALSVVRNGISKRN